MKVKASLNHGYKEDQRERALRASGQLKAEGGRAWSKPRPGSRTSELPSPPACPSLEPKGYSALLASEGASSTCLLEAPSVSHPEATTVVNFPAFVHSQENHFSALQPTCPGF